MIEQKILDPKSSTQNNKFKELQRQNPSQNYGFEYNGLEFNQESLHVFAGLCAVDNKENVNQIMQAVSSCGLQCTRMGAYKPRTSVYDFQGLGKECLPYVFESAGKHGIKVIAMEVTHESQVEEIDNCLEKLSLPTGVMLQVGTRNAQNFELLKFLGKQKTYPILYKRGFGISLEEAIHGAEYISSFGNNKIIFCFRGVKTHFASPHRNFVDFAQVPVIKRLTKMPVGIDPSHSVGTREKDHNGIMDLFHVTAQGIVSGANLVLVDFHPNRDLALVDGKQALNLDELHLFIEDIQLARECYVKRKMKMHY